MNDCLAQYLCNAEIQNHIQDDCENPMFSGIKATAWIWNYNDIVNIATDPENPQIVTYFDNGTDHTSGEQNVKGFALINQRNNPFTGTNIAVEVGDYRNTFTRTVSLFVPMDGGEVVKSIINPLANGRFVVVLRNDYVNSMKDNEYMLFGIDRGLVVSSLQQTKYENNDYWIVELQEAGVPTANKFFMYGGYHAEQTSGFSFTDPTTGVLVTVNTSNYTCEIMTDDTTLLTVNGVTLIQAPTSALAITGYVNGVISQDSGVSLYLYTEPVSGVQYGFTLRDASSTDAGAIYVVTYDSQMTADYLCSLTKGSSI